MKFNKNQYYVIIINLVVCVLSIFIAKVIIKPSYAVFTSNENNNENDFIDNNSIKFDISDFAYTKKSNIDIVNKKYDNNITVLDSDYVISDNLKNKINNVINNYGAANAFYIVSLDDGMSVGYNIDKYFETASSIKAPYALYIYKEIAKGDINPEEQITYEARHYNKGTGVIKNSSFGTKYTVKDLLFYSLNDSDNIAHQMLHSHFGVKGYNNMLKDLGTKQLYLTAGNPWAFTSCRSAALIWQEIYNFSIEYSEGVELLNILSNGKYNYFKEVMPDIPSASKTGFAGKDVVETGIVFDEKPYIAIAMANKGGKVGAYTQVLRLINVMNDVMNEYKEYSKN